MASQSVPAIAFAACLVAIHAGACGGSSSTEVSDPVVLATEQTNTWGIAVDETGIYWTCYSPINELRRMDIDGGEFETLVAEQNGANSVVYAESPGPSRAIALDAKNVYWSAVQDLVKVSK